MKLDRGWGWPMNSQKAHYYAPGANISLCGKWLYTGERQDDEHESPDNCAECKKRRPNLVRIILE